MRVYNIYSWPKFSQKIHYVIFVFCVCFHSHSLSLSLMYEQGQPTWERGKSSRSRQKIEEKMNKKKKKNWKHWRRRETTEYDPIIISFFVSPKKSFHFILNFWDLISYLVEEKSWLFLQKRRKFFIWKWKILNWILIKIWPCKFMIHLLNILSWKIDFFHRI